VFTFYSPPCVLQVVLSLIAVCVYVFRWGSSYWTPMTKWVNGQPAISRNLSMTSSRDQTVSSLSDYQRVICRYCLPVFFDVSPDSQCNSVSQLEGPLCPGHMRSSDILLIENWQTCIQKSCDSAKTWMNIWIPEGGSRPNFQNSVQATGLSNGKGSSGFKGRDKGECNIPLVPVFVPVRHF